MKQRIRHIFPHNAGSPAHSPANDTIPRGWITPQGHFHKTKEHWVTISSHFRRPETRAIDKEEAPEEADAAEKNAHLAYSLGWISVGHAGKLNAIGHRNTFEALNHPAVATLRKILADQPFLVITVETQVGRFVPARGVHEDFELRECDLDILIKRGRLRQARNPSE
jgi:hypothetical protein